MSNPTASIKNACPECGCIDVADSHGREKPNYHRPQYYCYGCGTRFDNPRQYDTVTEEYI